MYLEYAWIQEIISVIWLFFLHCCLPRIHCPAVLRVNSAGSVLLSSSRVDSSTNSHFRIFSISLTVMDGIPSAITADGDGVKGIEFVSFLALNSEGSDGIDGTNPLVVWAMQWQGTLQRMKDRM